MNLGFFQNMISQWLAGIMQLMAGPGKAFNLLIAMMQC